MFMYSYVMFMYSYVMFVCSLLCLCILIDMYALLFIFFTDWHSPATLTDFSVLFPQL